MNQPSCSLSLDLDTCSNSSDSLSECETLTVPDPNDPVTVQKFVEETVVGPISLQKQNVDRISAINSQLHIGDVHKNFFHFHGNIKPPTKEETQENGGNEPNSHHSSAPPLTTKNDKPPTPLSILKGNVKRLVFVTAAAILISTLVAVSLTLTNTSNPRITIVDQIPSSSTPASRKHYFFKGSSWGARSPAKPLPTLNNTVSKVIVKETKTSTCTTVSECFSKMQQLQFSDVGEHGLLDLRYNFVVGGDGNVYEGRGWTIQNEDNEDDLDVAFMGRFKDDDPEEFVLEALPWLIDEGVRLKYLEDGVKVVCSNEIESEFCDKIANITI